MKSTSGEKVLKAIKGIPLTELAYVPNLVELVVDKTKEKADKEKVKLEKTTKGKKAPKQKYEEVEKEREKSILDLGYTSSSISIEEEESKTEEEYMAMSTPEMLDSQSRLDAKYCKGCKIKVGNTAYTYSFCVQHCVVGEQFRLIGRAYESKGRRRPYRNDKLNKARLRSKTTPTEE